NASRQSALAPAAAVSPPALNAHFSPPARHRPPPATIDNTSSTVRPSSISSDSPSSRRCSRYRRSCSLASTKQRLHAIENHVGDGALRHERQMLFAAVACEERDAIRVDAKSGAGFGRVVHHDEVQVLGLELRSAAS